MHAAPAEFRSILNADIERATLQPADQFCKLAYRRRLGNGRAAKYTERRMFTGIIGTTGVLASREQRGPGARLRIAGFATSPGDPLAVGESIAVHGVCLTAETIDAGQFSCDATAETLARTTLGSIPIGARVHLER